MLSVARVLAGGDSTGLRNLMAIIVVLANFRLALENLIKYGVLVSPVMWARMVYPGSACGEGGVGRVGGGGPPRADPLPPRPAPPLQPTS